MRKTLLTLLLAAVPVAGIGVAATAEAATPPVMISYLYFDSPGSDNRSVASLNSEYIRVTNTTTKAIELEGWTIRDASNHVFTFPSLALGGGTTVTVHTGKGTDRRPSTTDRYWQQGNYVWNNTGDTATVRNSAGKTIDTCTYTSRQTPATRC